MSTPDLTSITRTVLYKVDGTYSEWAISRLSTVQPSGTVAPHSGTFTYAVDPQNAGHASIVYDGGAGSVPTDELYFATANSGTLGLPSASFTVRAFTLYPAQTSTGGVNFSTRSTLVARGTTISGLVIGPGTARWVLLRAVGTSMRSMGVPSTVTGPSFTLHNSKQVLGTSSVWSADPNLVNGYNSAFAMVGAFPLTAASDEGVLLLPLDPGLYTLVASANSPGDILCEVYFLPF